MYTFIRNASFTSTHALVLCWNLFYCGGNNIRNVESMIIILFSSDLASLRPPPFGSLTRLLWSSLTDTWSKKIRNICGPVWSPHLHVAVRIGTGGDAPHTGEELKGTQGPNSSGGTKNSTRLTSKYVLRGKTKEAKIIRQLKLSLFFGELLLRR